MNKDIPILHIKRLEIAAKKIGKKIKIKKTVKNGIPYVDISFVKK